MIGETVTPKTWTGDGDGGSRETEERGRRWFKRDTSGRRNCVFCRLGYLRASLTVNAALMVNPPSSIPYECFLNNDFCLVVGSSNRLISDSTRSPVRRYHSTFSGTQCGTGKQRDQVVQLKHANRQLIEVTDTSACFKDTSRILREPHRMQSQIAACHD